MKDLGDPSADRLHRIWRAGFVQRWHTNPDLAHTGDRLDGHCARVARIVMALWPEDTRTMRAALIHDDGEHIVGDTPPTSARTPDQKDAEIAVITDLWGDFTVSAIIYNRLKFADRLDAYLWAKHHAPHVLTGDGWPRAILHLKSRAKEMGVAEQVKGLLS